MMPNGFPYCPGRTCLKKIGQPIVFHMANEMMSIKGMTGIRATTLANKSKVLFISLSKQLLEDM
jgi:hypothetical protein